MKYECVYLHAFETGSELRAGLHELRSAITTSGDRIPVWVDKRPTRPIIASGRHRGTGGMT